MITKRLYEAKDITDDMLAQWYCEYYGIEVWKDIPGYEGYYQASTLGRVRSLTHNRVVNVFNKATVVKKVRGRVLSIKGKNNSGYYSFSITINGKRHSLLLHRAIAETFLPNPRNFKQVNHKDEDKTNNCVFNLEWCDVKYNVNYGTARKRSSQAKSKPVCQYTKDGVLIKEWDSATDAHKQLGISLASICHVCNGDKSSYTAGGYIWKFK